MAQVIKNYARFYTLLKQLPGADKETLVWQYTQGRTKSLREVSRWEYDVMCRDMERVLNNDKKRRSGRLDCAGHAVECYTNCKFTVSTPRIGQRWTPFATTREYRARYSEN